MDTSSIVESFKIIKFKRNLKELIIISVLDTSSIVQSFKTIKFKRNYTKVIRICVLDSSLNVLKLLNLKEISKSNYDFCFWYFMYSSKF